MARGIGLWRGRGWLWKLVVTLLVLLVPAPILLLLIFRVLPIPGTPEMLVSLIQGKGASYGWSDDISPRLSGSSVARSLASVNSGAMCSIVMLTSSSRL